MTRAKSRIAAVSYNSEVNDAQYQVVSRVGLDFSEGEIRTYVLTQVLHSRNGFIGSFIFCYQIFVKAK